SASKLTGYDTRRSPFCGSLMWSAHALGRPSMAISPFPPISSRRYSNILWRLSAGGRKKFNRFDRSMDATELAFAGIARQAALIAAGEISSRELVELYLERIGRLDPRLNAFRVVLAERALLEADQADARRGAGGERPLLGVPIAVKDDIDVAGEVTALGTNAHGGPV